MRLLKLNDKQLIAFNLAAEVLAIVHFKALIFIVVIFEISIMALHEI